MKITIEDIIEVVLATRLTEDRRFELHGGAILSEAPEVIDYEGREFRLANREDDSAGDEVQFWVYSKIDPQPPERTAGRQQITIADVFHLLLAVKFRTDGKYGLSDGTAYANAPDGFEYQGHEFELVGDEPHDYIPKSEEVAYWEYTNAGTVEEFENVPE